MDGETFRGILLSGWFSAIAATVIAIIVFTTITAFKMRHRPPKPAPKVIPPKMSLDEMNRVIKDRASSKAQRLAVIDSILYHYSPLTPKDGYRIPKDAKKIIDMIFTLISHSGLEVSRLNKFITDLSKENPDYAEYFDNAKQYANDDAFKDIQIPGISGRA